MCSCLQCPQLSELVHFLLWEFSMTFYIFHRHRVCLVDHVDLICNLYSWWEGFWVFFLSHTAPGFQLWFYFHLYMWAVHWGLLLRLPWRTRVCPCEGQVWRWQLLELEGFWQHQVLRGVGGYGSRKYSTLEGYGNQYWPIRSSILAWTPPSLTEKPGRPVYRVAKSRTQLK